MAKIKIENLIKYCRTMAEAESNPETDWAVQKRRYRVIAEELEAFDTMTKRDDTTTAKNVVGVGRGWYEGTCTKCKAKIDSKMDFCPRCGRPIDWDSSVKTARKI